MDEIKIEPTPEKNRRINPNIIRGVILIFGLVVLWFMFGGSSDDSKNKKPKVDEVSGNIIKEETFSNLKNKNNDKLPNSNVQPVQPQKPQTLPDNDYDSQRYTNQNYDNQYRHQPVYSVDSAQIAAEERQREALQKKQDDKEKEIKKGQRSPIFFTLPSDKEKNTQVKKNEPVLNQYYNDGYIEIVGEEMKK